MYRFLSAFQALKPQSMALPLVFVMACAGAKEQPRQAQIPDQADPAMTENPANASSASGSSAGSGKSSDPQPAKNSKFVVGKGGEPPQVASLAAFSDGLKWGMSHAELTKQYTQTGGVLWKDYDEKLAKARVGPEQTALEAEREQAKGAFNRSYTEFKETPTGLDTTGIRGEYTYKNKEAVMWIQRHGKTRYFFFINDRLWKVYDEVPLGEEGHLGTSYVEAVNKLNGQLNAQGRVQSADAAKGISATTVDWKDGSSHLRAVDRSNDHVIGIVLEDSGTLSNLAALRPNKLADPNEIDPSVLAVTKGTNRVDPFAAPSASASGKKQPPPAPKKK